MKRVLLEKKIVEFVHWKKACNNCFNILAPVGVIKSSIRPAGHKLQILLRFYTPLYNQNCDRKNTCHTIFYNLYKNDFDELLKLWLFL